MTRTSENNAAVERLERLKARVEICTIPSAKVSQGGSMRRSKAWRPVP